MEIHSYKSLFSVSEVRNLEEYIHYFPFSRT